jgi:hypothetical protein
MIANVSTTVNTSVADQGTGSDAAARDITLDPYISLELCGAMAWALGDGLFELRRNQVRLFYMFEPGQIIRLLGGMVKKQDRIPGDVLAQMRGYQKDARERLKKAKTDRKR